MARSQVFCYYITEEGASEILPGVIRIRSGEGPPGQASLCFSKTFCYYYTVPLKPLYHFSLPNLVRLHPRVEPLEGQHPPQRLNPDMEYG